MGVLAVLDWAVLNRAAPGHRRPGAPSLLPIPCNVDLYPVTLPANVVDAAAGTPIASPRPLRRRSRSVEEERHPDLCPADLAERAPA